MKTMRKGKEAIVTDLVMVYGENEWQALYDGGVLVMSGSSLNETLMLEALVGYTIRSFDSFVVKADWLEEVAEFPIELANIPEDARLK